jgi:hypothetical protein
VTAAASPPARAPLLLASGTLAFYLATLAPGLVWADGGRLQVEAITGASVYWHFDELKQVATDGWPFDRLGVAAWDHPVWVILGHALVKLPPGAPGWKLNLFSALAATGGVVAVYAIIRRLAGNAWAAVAGGLALAVAHTYWFHAVTAQVHALNALFTAILIGYAVGPRELSPARWAGLAMLAGLGMANHVMLGLAVVLVTAYLIISRMSVPPWTAAIWFVVGLAPWWLQMLRMAHVAGFATTLTVAAGFPWLGDRWPGPLSGLPANLVGYLGMLLYQFTPLGCALGGYGAWHLWQRRRGEAQALLLLFTLYALFSVNYNVPDRFAFHLPSYLVFAIFIGCGVAGLGAAMATWAKVWRRATAGALVLALALPIVAYAAAPGLLRGRGVTDADLGIPPVGGRDGIAFFLDPNSRGDDSAERFGRQALAGLAPRALVMLAWPQDREAYLIMRYFQLTEQLRPDVTLDLMMFTGKPVHDSVLDIAAAQRGCRPLYLMSDDPRVYPVRALISDFTIGAEGRAFRLQPRADRIGSCPGQESAPVRLDDLLRRVRR